MIKKIILTILCIATFGNTILAGDTKTPKLFEKGKVNLKAFSTLLTSKKIDAEIMIEGLNIFVAEASKVESKLKSNDKAILKILKDELAWAKRVNRSPADTILVLYSKLKPHLGKSKGEIAGIVILTVFACIFIGLAGVASWEAYKRHKYIQSLDTPEKQLIYLQQYRPELFQAILAYRNGREIIKSCIPYHSRRLLEQVFHLGFQTGQHEIQVVTENDVRDIKESVERECLQATLNLPELAYATGKVHDDILKRLPKNFSKRILDDGPEIQELG